MIASAHVAAGFVAGMASAYAARRTPARVAIAFSLGILSHVVMDAIPHSDYAPLDPLVVRWVSMCEIVVTCTVAAFILRRRLTPSWPAYLLPGIAGAVIPDAKFFARMALPKDLAQSVEWYGDYFHSFFHAKPMSRPAIGWAIDIACAIVLLTILTLFPPTAPASSRGYSE